MEMLEYVKESKIQMTYKIPNVYDTILLETHTKRKKHRTKEK